MAILRRATESTQSDWVPVPEGLWRWVIGVPELKLSEKYGNYQVRFPLMLTQNEQARLKADHGDLAEGEQQSWRSTYSVGLSLGFVQRDGQYKSTKLIDFLAASLGTANGKAFRDWIASGGGPPPPADKNDQKAELAMIQDWIKWWENMEVYGSIRHEADKSGSGAIWANFAGPMPVGSLPGQKDNDYQALGRGKLRAIIAESGGLPEREPALVGAAAGVSAAPDDSNVRFTQDGEVVKGDGSAELPF